MDYNECCRSCIQPISDKVNLLTDNKILNLFEDCTRLKINKEDALPKYLCSICYSKCSKWKEFQEECKQNEKFLIDWCFNESKSAVKTEIVFLDLGIKEESDSDDNGFDLMPENDDNSCNESESEDRKLKTNCVVKLEDIVKSGKVASNVIDETSKSPKIKPITEKIKSRDPNTLLAPIRILVTKSTNLSNLNVSNKFNYFERMDENTESIKKSNTGITNINENESELIKSESNDLNPKADSKESQPSSSDMVNEKNLAERNRTKRVYREDEESDDNDGISDDEFFKIKKNQPTVIFKCKVCRKTFRNFEVYELHFLCVHMEKEPFECKICCAKYARSKKFEGHLIKMHIPMTSTATVFCGVCEQGFEKERQLNKHSKMHVVPVLHSCDQCDKKYKEMRSLLIHQDFAHSNKERDSFKCKECEKTFLIKASLTVHIKKHHLKEFNSICNICGKLFATNSKLLDHIKFTHNDERPHKCPICPCKYKKNYHLRIHMTTHTGERQFKCPYCDKSFNRRTVMKQHAMTHTGERPHVCAVCNRGFIQRISLKNHICTHGGAK